MPPVFITPGKKIEAILNRQNALLLKKFGPLWPYPFYVLDGSEKAILKMLGLSAIHI
jgi:hypothetical protein